MPKTKTLVTRDELMDWLVQRRLVAEEYLNAYKTSCFMLMRTTEPREGFSRLDYARQVREDLAAVMQTLQTIDDEMASIAQAMMDDEPWISDAAKHGMLEPCKVTGDDEQS